MNVAPPSSQKADVRPISFVLDDQAAGSPPISVNLALRPEDMTRTDPSRLNVQQTLGGAWADNFGPGVPTINISGHTGWRRLAGSSGDGLDRFEELKTTVFDQWHSRRRDAVQAGRDPDLVQLVYSDALDNFAVVVAPTSFVLRRSKSRPLLMQYQISLTVLDQNVDQKSFLQVGLGGLLDNDVLEQSGLDSLVASIGEITRFARDIREYLDRTIAAPVQTFMHQTARLYGQVRAAIAEANGIADSLIGVAQMTAQAGLNIFRTVAAVASIPGQVRARAMQIAGAYSNIWCVLRNALRQQIYYPDYSDLFGASNCSSTSGGRPISVLAGENPFYSVVPTPSPPPVTVTQGARGNLQSLATTDTVLSPMPISQIGILVQGVNDGMEFA